MKPQDLVALILTVGIMVGLLSGTRLGVWLFPTDITQPVSEKHLEFWSNTVNIILGAIAGYIAGRNNRD